jgi:hypothetical protein
MRQVFGCKISEHFASGVKDARRAFAKGDSAVGDAGFGVRVAKLWIE